MTETAIAERREHSYGFWHRALKGEKQPVHEGEPHPGRWYMRQKGGPRLPVATWVDDDDNLVALVGFDGQAELRDPVDIWTYVCQHPVTEEVYRAAYETGQWPDDPPPVAASPVAEPDAPADKFAQAKAMLEGEAEASVAYFDEPIETKEQADKVSVLATRVGKLAKRADDIRKAEKQPHLDAGRVVDAKWAEVIDGAKELVARLKKHVEPFLLAQRKAEEERQRAEREKADELRRQAAEANDPDSRQELTQKASEADREAEARNPSAGRTGSKVALRSEKVARIVDYDKLLLALKDDADVRELVTRLANRSARSGVALPGMEIETRQRAA